MSMDPDYSAPPPPPPSYAPPPPPSYGGDGPRLPWEERQQLGFFDALVATVKLIAQAPADAYRRLRPDGDYVSPILFAVILMWVGVVFSQIWGLLFSGAMSALSSIPGMEMLGGGGGFVSAIIAIVLAPIFCVIGLFIGAGLIHLALMVLSALQQSRFGFEGSLKVVAYASIGSLANIVPIVGGLIGGIISLILIVIGIQEVHGTSRDKAILAVVIIIAIACLCGLIISLAFGAMIAAAFGAAAAANS